MKSTCVHHPQSNRYIQVYEWQIAFCNQNHCAAFLLSNFIAWHDWKLNHDEYYLRANNIAELHGDGRPNNQNAYLFFTMDDLADGILNLYGKNAINTALQLLEDLKVISVHKNPNPRYHFDKTKYFMFYPEVCNEWIKTSLETKENQNQTVEDLNQSFDPLKEDDRSLESNRPSLKKGEAITYTTSNINNNNNNARDVLLSNREFAESIIQNNTESLEHYAQAFGCPYECWHETPQNFFEANAAGARLVEIVPNAQQTDDFWVSYEKLE